MRLRFLFLFCLFFLSFGYAKPPTLTPHDTKIKIYEILKSHITYQELNEEVIKRSFLNYLEELDPLKTYFVESEVINWISPSEELISKALKGIQEEDFTVFTEMHANFLNCLPRRENFEKEVASRELPHGVKSSEFKDLSWAKDEQSLEERLLRIRSLQLDTADKLSSTDKDQFLQRLEKRRLCREEELKGKSTEERKQIVLSHVLKSVSGALDSQTAYFTPSEANQFMMQVQQKLYGIGAQLRDDLNGLTITRLLEGSPAALGGQLRVGDKIIAVNKEPIVGMDISDAVDLIKGRQGTAVMLTVLRANEPSTSNKEETLEIEIIRDEVVLKETRLESSLHPFGDGVIGIFHLFSFYEDAKSSSASDLYREINEIKKNHNLKGIILDLRGNLGGVLHQAVAVTGLFISRGVVVSVKYNTGKVDHLRNLDGKKIWDGPLLVLTNRLSASASEIVAQTLQEYGRALVVGDHHTFGKGTFQTFTLESASYGKVNPKGEYKVTCGRYYTVSGKSPQLVGVAADITIPGALSEMDIGEKFAKFPVGTDEIDASFHDDLSDVSPLLRNQIRRLYKSSHQTQDFIYASYLDTLKANSEKRISSNKHYQSFLKEASKKDDQSSSFLDTLEQSDLQLTEALNVMTDLIFLFKPLEQENLALEDAS
jgi:carboxyl-terminal processing protease